MLEENTTGSLAGILVLVETEGWGYGRAFAIVAGKGAAPYLQKEKISGIESDFVADMRVI